MPKFLVIIIFLLLTHSSSLITHHSYARTTPEDIVNSKREAYLQKVSKYSQTNQQKLKKLSQNITEVNKKATDELSQIMERQAQILDEYIRRTGTDPRYQTDGIHRNLNNKIENARYFLTFAHEAVAFQAAKIYIFDLFSEKNIKGDALSTISQLQSDLNILRGKVTKSQNIIKDLIKNKNL